MSQIGMASDENIFALLATTLVQGLILVTCNVKHIEGGVRLINPLEA